MKYAGIPATNVVELARYLNAAQPINILSLWYDPRSKHNRFEALVLLPESPPMVMFTLPWHTSNPLGGQPT